jgi:LL-diaminopimelate aminotransferase
MIDSAQRLHSVQEYYFSKKLREVALLKENQL